MDRRVFVALGIIAAAAGSPALALQVERAQERGQMLHVNRASLLDAIYRIGVADNGASVGAEALVALGHNREEASQMATLAVSIIRKAGSSTNFAMLVDGQRVPGVTLDARETALLRRVSASRGRDGGRTWEGHSLRAAGGIWDGRTWEGSAITDRRRVPETRRQ